MQTLAKRIENTSRYYNYAKMVNDIVLMKMCEHTLHDLMKQEAIFLHEKMVNDIELEMHIDEKLNNIPSAKDILTQNGFITMSDAETKQIFL